MLDIACENIKNHSESSVIWKPLEIYNNFNYSESFGRFTPPFASAEEARGLRSGREGTVLCTREDPIVSKEFVQCNAALIKNKNIGLISLIHQSTWLDSSKTILNLQKTDDIDVVTINGPNRGMRFDDIQTNHCKSPNDYNGFKKIDRNNEHNYHSVPLEHKNLVHKFFGSQIAGISTEEMDFLYKREEQNKNFQGKTNLVGNIILPISYEERNKWSLLYRPKENVIWVYALGKSDGGISKLFKYQGFPE